MERIGAILLICLAVCAFSCSQRSVAEVTSDDVINPPGARNSSTGDNSGGVMPEAAPTGSVKGTLLLDSAPVSSYAVQFLRNGRFFASARTDKEGQYYLSDLPPGDYTIWLLNFADMPVPGYEGYVLVREERTETKDISIISS